MARLIDTNWRLLAACRSAEPDLFFPVSSSGKSLEQVNEAKAVCARCLVRRQCLAFALLTRQVHGIWGGLTEQERDAIPSAKADTASAGTGPRRGQRRGRTALSHRAQHGGAPSPCGRLGHG